MNEPPADAVLDTNVPVVANKSTPHANQECILACVRALRQFQDGRMLLLDDKGLILDEYRKNLSASGQPGPGDAFFRWLWDNQANERHCRAIAVTPNDDLGFEEFPDDPRLGSFDVDDRKFVAVAVASTTDPEVLNASDTDWWHYLVPLNDHGVSVTFLCPELMGAQASRA